MARVKAYIYRYRFFVPILELSTVGWLVASLVAMLSIVNQLIIYEVLFLLFTRFRVFYSNLFKHPQN
tara:strand:- start:1914 stop:2114 length:201 start_codon:yes stop_codon:yes gene_type:complete